MPQVATVSSAQLQAVGGLLDFFSFSFDRKVFFTHLKLRSGTKDIGIAAKDAASLPAKIDDMLIDGMIAATEKLFDQLAGTGPLVVGQSMTTASVAKTKAATLQPDHSLADVEDAITAAGGNSGAWPSWLMLVLQYTGPLLIQLIEKLLGK